LQEDHFPSSSSLPQEKKGGKSSLLSERERRFTFLPTLHALFSSFSISVFHLPTQTFFGVIRDQVQGQKREKENEGESRTSGKVKMLSILEDSQVFTYGRRWGTSVRRRE